MSWTWGLTADVIVLLVFAAVAILIVCFQYMEATRTPDAINGIATVWALLLGLLILIYAAGTFDDMQAYLLYQICPVCE